MCLWDHLSSGEVIFYYFAVYIKAKASFSLADIIPLGNAEIYPNCS